MILKAGVLLGHDSFDVREQTTAALVQAPALVAGAIAMRTKEFRSQPASRRRPQPGPPCRAFLMSD